MDTDSFGSNTLIFMGKRVVIDPKTVEDRLRMGIPGLSRLTSRPGILDIIMVGHDEEEEVDLEKFENLC